MHTSYNCYVKNQSLLTVRTFLLKHQVTHAHEDGENGKGRINQKETAIIVEKEINETSMAINTTRIRRFA